jgi:hypothetical protein
MENHETIPAEDVARHFIDRERSNPFSPMYRGHYDAGVHEINHMRARLTEVIKRGRMERSHKSRAF